MARPRTQAGDPDGGGVAGTGRDALQPAERKTTFGTEHSEGESLCSRRASDRDEDAGAAEELGLDVQVVELDESTRTATDAARAVGCDVAQIVKSLVLVAAGEAVLCLCAGDRRVDLEGIGGEARMATAAEARTRQASPSAASRRSAVTGQYGRSSTPRCGASARSGAPPERPARCSGSRPSGCSPRSRTRGSQRTRPFPRSAAEEKDSLWGGHPSPTPRPEILGRRVGLRPGCASGGPLLWGGPDYPREEREEVLGAGPGGPWAQPVGVAGCAQVGP